MSSLRISLFRDWFFMSLRHRVRRKGFGGLVKYALHLLRRNKIEDEEWLQLCDVLKGRRAGRKLQLLNRFFRLARGQDIAIQKGNPFIKCVLEEIHTRLTPSKRKYVSRFPHIYYFHAPKRPADLSRLYLDPTWIAAIGHFSYIKHLKDYLTLSRLGQTELLIDFSTLPRQSNRYLLETMSAQYDIRDYRHAGEPLLQSPYLPVDGELQHSYTLGETTVRLHDHDVCPHNLRFPEKDMEGCAATMERLGLGRDDWFVAVHCRSSGFRDGGDPGTEIRNTDIRKLRPAIDHIAARGGKIVRMGDPSMPEFRHPAVIDYAHSPLKSQMLDIYLAAHCRFMIGSMSGMTHVPSLFGVPIIYVDSFPFFALNVAYKVDYVLPQLLVDSKTGRKLPFSEYFERNLYVIQTKRFFHLMGYRLLDTSPEDILLTVERALENGFHQRTVREEETTHFFNTHGCTTVARFPDHFAEKHRNLFA